MLHDQGASAPPGGSAQPDPKQINALTSKLISASIGDIVVVMSESPAHRHLGLADIEWMVLPAVLTGQYYVAEVQHKETGARAPVAVVTWASVSDQIDTRLRERPTSRIRLTPHEWKSGEHLWIVDVAGDERGSIAALKQLTEGVFRQRLVSVIANEASGQSNVRLLSDIIASLSSGNNINSEATRG